MTGFPKGPDWRDRSYLVDINDVIDRPGEPFLGTGEAAQGPAGAAIANAIANATGVRLRDVPLTREKIKAAVGV